MRLTTRNARRLAKMHAANPVCHWCNRLTVLVLSRSGKLKGSKDENAATIDHLYHRRDPRRQAANPQPVVLACQKCNIRRGTKDDKKFAAVADVT